MKFIKLFEEYIENPEGDVGKLKYGPGDVIYVFQYHSSKSNDVSKKYVVGKDNTTQKWCEVEIIEPISDEKGWERYKVKQLDGYRDEDEFVAYQSQMSKFNDKPISIGYDNPDEVSGNEINKK